MTSMQELMAVTVAVTAGAAGFVVHAATRQPLEVPLAPAVQPVAKPEPIAVPDFTIAPARPASTRERVVRRRTRSRPAARRAPVVRPPSPPALADDDAPATPPRQAAPPQPAAPRPPVPRPAPPAPERETAAPDTGGSPSQAFDDTG